MAVFSHGAFVADPWRALEDDAAIPARGHVVLSLEQWREQRAALGGSAQPLGLALAPGAPLGEIAADLARFALIALAFPKYTDGRGYSLAHSLRKLGFAGELRATGNVLFDQLQLMARCGFDSFEIAHEPTLQLLRSGRRPDVGQFYQPGFGAEIPAGTRPWARRRTETI